MRIVMPLKENNGPESRVTGHPRMAPYFAVAEIDGAKQMSLNIIENPYKGEEHHEEHHHQGGTQFFRFLEGLMPDAFISYNVGEGAFFRFKEMGVKMYMPKGHTVKENVQAFTAGELKELAGPSD
ncbi:MAG: NifB/NifX family molybdenum-iron cluster-binding protein [Nitrososphaeria archaeon]